MFTKKDTRKFRPLLKGDSWSIPENREHQVEVLEDAAVFELFSPIRPDYLP